MNTRYRIWLLWIFSSIMLFSLSACSSDPDDGTIIGTGVMLRGTASSNKTFASNTIEVRATSGETSTGTIGSQGRFTVNTLNGDGPWLMRTSLGNNSYLYGFATQQQGTQEITQNIHSYTDAVARNWFATQGTDIDTVFTSSGSITNSPTRSQLAPIRARLAAVVTDVLDAYELTGTELHSADYAANGAGVDLFLLQNPVVQINGNITIIIYDPASDTQSVAAQDVMLTTLLDAPDTIAPEAPAGLRALPSAINEITLVWDVASDNIGITRYVIVRDGQRIATSPFPVYVDIGLNANTQFTYSIIAIDSAGNESPASPSVAASPLTTQDTTPPPAPINVEINKLTGRLDVSWAQSSINDVASFAIRRGNFADDLLDHANVTSTFLLDSAVNAGVQYCYDVRAVDASNNISSPSAVVCDTVPGNIVTGTPDTQNPEALTAPEVDVTSLACTELLGFSSVTSNITLTPGCYLAERSISITEPGNLTIEPGVVIKFSSARSLTVNQGGSLTGDATADNPIVLTGLEATPGYWSGVEFNGSNSSRNILDHVQIEYAGSFTQDTGALAIETTNDRPVSAIVSNTTVRFNAGPGISLDESAVPSTFDGNRITGNAIPVSSHPSQAGQLDKRSDYTGNTVDAIKIRRDTVALNTQWPALPIPYHSESVNIEAATFGIEAGATVLFNADAELVVNSDSTLSLIGSSDAPITLSAQSSAVDGWQGIEVRYSGTDNRIEHTIIDRAGFGNSEAGAIGIQSFDRNRSRITLNNVTIQNGAGYGISAESWTQVLGFNGMSITGHDAVADVDVYTAQGFNNSGVFLGNVEDIIQLKNASTWEGDVSLANTDLIYRADQITVSEASLSLQPGVTLEMEAGGDILLSSNGILSAIGSPAAPIEIVGRERQAGYWTGITVSASTSPLNRLSHVLLADGGGLADAPGNIRFSCIGVNPLQYSIDNSRIENSLGYGLFFQRTTDCDATLDEATTFSGNALGQSNR